VILRLRSGQALLGARSEPFDYPFDLPFDLAQDRAQDRPFAQHGLAAQFDISRSGLDLSLKMC
jgi:hypothetical protein